MRVRVRVGVGVRVRVGVRARARARVVLRHHRRTCSEPSTFMMPHPTMSLAALPAPSRLRSVASATRTTFSLGTPLTMSTSLATRPTWVRGGRGRGRGGVGFRVGFGVGVGWGWGWG